MDDLRKKYRQFADRKKLRKEFSHFLVDDRVMQQVINLLGKVLIESQSFCLKVVRPYFHL